MTGYPYLPHGPLRGAQRMVSTNSSRHFQKDRLRQRMPSIFERR